MHAVKAQNAHQQNQKCTKNENEYTWNLENAF